MTREDGFDFGGVPQEAFLARIRRSSGRKGPGSEHPGSLIRPNVEENAAHSEKVHLFTRALEGVGGRVFRASTLAEAYHLVARELAQAKAARVLVAGGDFTGLEEALAAAGVACDRWTDLDFSHGSEYRQAEKANAWDAGISFADYAVADLGSIALLFDAAQGRSVSLVPPRYVSIVRPSALVPSRRAVLEDVSRRFRKEGRRGSLVFVTGPSRSADIEMDLSVGVHGPGELWAVLVDE